MIDLYKILYLHDISAGFEMIPQELDAFGLNYELEVVTTKADYVRALDTLRPDVVLCTDSLSSFHFLEAMGILKSTYPAVAFIVARHSSENTDRLSAIDRADDYVVMDKLKRMPYAIINAVEKLRDEKSLGVHVEMLNTKDEDHGAISRGNIADQRVSESEGGLAPSPALTEVEAKYRSLIESSTEAILLTTKSGRVIAANTAACVLFGMTEEELLSKKRSDLVATKDPRFKQLFDERNITGHPRDEFTFIRKDKSVFPGELSSVIFTNAYGEERISSTIRDISSRINSEQKLLEASSDLRDALNGLNKIMDSSVDIICAVDAKGNFIKVSAACERIWGYTPAELLGKPLINFVYHEDAKGTLATANRVMNGQLVNHFENRYIRKDGSLVTMEWTARWDEKEQVRYGVARDVTEKKGLETAVEMERMRLQGLYLQAPSCMVILKGPEYVYEVANPLYLQLIGRSDIIGKKLKDVLPELITQGHFEILEEVYKSGRPYVGNEVKMQFDVNGTGILVDKYLNFIYQVHQNVHNE